jgi:hypothetical protein
MWRTLRVSAFAALLVVGAVGSAAAQRRGLIEITNQSTRHGFWVNVGGGFGEESFAFGDSAYSNTLGKGTFTLAVGGTPDPHLRLGAEVTAWTNPTTGLDESGNVQRIHETFTALMLVGQFYPIDNSGLFVKGGLGYAWSGKSLSDFSGPGSSVTEGGLATAFGAGYEVRLGRRLWLTPRVELIQGRFEQRGEATLHERVVNYAVGLTFQP